MSAGSDNNAARSGVGWSIAIWCGLALLLALPALAMQVTTEVNWSLGDFGLMAALLAAVGIGIELVMRLLRNPGARTAAVVAILIVFLLIWTELAVGVFGTSFAGT